MLNKWSVNKGAFIIKSSTYCNKSQSIPTLCIPSYFKEDHVRLIFPNQHINTKYINKRGYKEKQSWYEGNQNAQTIIKSCESHTLFDQSCYIIQFMMELAIQNVRKSHRLLMNATSSQINSSGVSRSSNFPQNDEPATHNTSSTSCERKRFKTIQKNGCVRFVQQKEIAAVRPSPDKSETNSNSQHHLKHKRSSTSIQFRSDAVTETMKIRLEGKIQEARNKLESMKKGFQRCLEKKQQIVNKVKNANIVTRRFSMMT